MKFSLVTVAAVAGLFVTGWANPVPVPAQGNALQGRQLEKGGEELDALMATVEKLTASINATMAGVPENLSDEDAAKVMKDLEPLVNELKNAMAKATETLQGIDDKRDVVARAACGKSCVVGKATGIVDEVSYTVLGLVNGLGADRVLVLVQPLLTQVTGLISCLDGLVSGLTKVLGGLLGSILGGVGLDGLLSNLLGGILGGLLGGVLGGDAGILDQLLGKGGLLGGLLGEGGLLGGLLGGGLGGLLGGH